MPAYKVRFSETYSVDCSTTVVARTEEEARQKVIDGHVDQVDGSVCWDCGQSITDENIYAHLDTQVVRWPKSVVQEDDEETP